MSFFGAKLFGLGGGGGSGNGSTASSASNTNSSSISGAETIERLCDRVQSASLIEDRRESLKTIKSLSKKYKLEVGTQAMTILIEVIDKNRMDIELCCLALDILFNVFEKTNDQDQVNLPNDITEQFTEIFIKNNANVQLLFDLLDEFEFQVRWCTLKLLNVLIINQTQQLQEIILQIPRGVSRLMDLLSDSREVIRNDTILLLNNLTKTNANIQKIVAFESGFDRVMEIIEGEGSAIDGGIVVEDCFNLLLNLLQTNYSNQNYFKEANYIKKLSKFLDLTNSSNLAVSMNESSPDNESQTNWTLQKTTNLNLLLKLLRCLVAPTNQQLIINDCQKAFNHFGLLHRLCALLMLPGVPADLLSEAITTVGEVIRGNAANQQLFSAVQMQTNPARPIVTILLMSMINEKQPFHLRCSILYCFECFLYKNEQTKAEIVETLLPKENHSAAQSHITTGQILCTGLFSQTEFVSNWLCAVAIAHTINENNALKEQMLRVQLAVSATNNGAVSMMQQCMNILIESSSSSTAAHNANTPAGLALKFQTNVSILMLLSTWLSNCSVAVNYFLSQQQNIPYLISQVSSTDTEEKSLIVQGLNAFLLGLSMLYNTNQIENYTIEKLKDIIKKRIGIEQFEDKLEYISQHELYTKTLKMPTFAFKCKQAAELLFDYEFTRLFKSNETLILNLLSNKNQIALLNGAPKKEDDSKRKMDAAELEQHNTIIAQYQQIIREQDSKLKEQIQLNQMLTQTCSQLQEHYHNVCGQYNSLRDTLASREVEHEKMMRETVERNKQQAESPMSEKLSVQARINELEVKVNLLEEKCSEQEDELSKLQRDKGNLQETINNLKTNETNSDFIELQMKHKQLQVNYKQLNQEQENLLILLQEMETKMKDYRHLLKRGGYGDDLSESDEEEEQVGGAEEAAQTSQQNLAASFENGLSLDEKKNNDLPSDQYEPNRGIILSRPNFSSSNSGSNVNCSLNSTTNSSENSADVKSPAIDYPPPTGQNFFNDQSAAFTANPIQNYF